MRTSVKNANKFEKVLNYVLYSTGLMYLFSCNTYVIDHGRPHNVTYLITLCVCGGGRDHWPQLIVQPSVFCNVYSRRFPNFPPEILFPPGNFTPNVVFTKLFSTR